MAQQVITSTKILKEAKRANSTLTREQKKEKSETASLRTEIRKKLQKLLARIPVFMYVTQFRELAVKDIITGVEKDLFERVTGLTVTDFKLLNQIGVFNKLQMDAAVYQFKAFEDASLEYADEPGARHERKPIGLWDKVMQQDETIEDVLERIQPAGQTSADPAPVTGKAKKRWKRKKR